MKFFALILLWFPCFSYSQTGYKTGDIVGDLKIAKLLNYSSTSSSLNKLQSRIIIIDFFGTWCAPCIKALPELEAYKNKFKEEISILLVSTEAESKLTKFMSSRQPFIFPMVVDEDNLFTNNFKPPSYPYTVVLDKNLKVLSVTNAADLSENILKKFLDEGKQIMETKPTTSAIVNQPATKTVAQAYTASNNTLIKLSQNFMYAAKTNEEVTPYINQLKDLKYDELLKHLKTDHDKKAFWINLYNAYTNASLHKNPDLYKKRNQFFKAKNIDVAGKTLSLDKIEHGILRRSKIKWSLGYLNKFFPNKTEKELRVNKLDNRIHFALNCGAKSCPPIAFYNAENLNTQLDVAATAYLTNEANYNIENNILYLPALLSWFRRDFGGKKKIIELLKSKQLLATTVKPNVRFKKYDWVLYLDNYKN